MIRLIASCLLLGVLLAVTLPVAAAPPPVQTLVQLETAEQTARALDEPRVLLERADAEARVQQHLREAAVQRRFSTWLTEWLARLLSRWFQPDGSVEANGQALWWVALVAGLAGAALLARGIARSLVGHGPGMEAGAGQGRRAAAARPQTPEELRQSARALAQSGELKEALRTSHLAILRHLDRLELLRYGSAQTHREHERQLRHRHPGLARRLRLLNDLIEEHIYSGRDATADDFRECERQAEELWREGETVSKSAAATPGAS